MGDQDEAEMEETPGNELDDYRRGFNDGLATALQEMAMRGHDDVVEHCQKFRKVIMRRKEKRPD